MAQAVQLNLCQAVQIERVGCERFANALKRLILSECRPHRSFGSAICGGGRVRFEGRGVGGAGGGRLLDTFVRLFASVRFCCFAC